MDEDHNGAIDLLEQSAQTIQTIPQDLHCLLPTIGRDSRRDSDIANIGIVPGLVMTNIAMV